MNNTRRKLPTRRDRAIAGMKANGCTVAVIARSFGLSKQRVGDLLKKVDSFIYLRCRQVVQGVKIPQPAIKRTKKARRANKRLTFHSPLGYP